MTKGSTNTTRKLLGTYTAIDYVGVRNCNKNNEFILRDVTAICDRKGKNRFPILS